MKLALLALALFVAPRPIRFAPAAQESSASTIALSARVEALQRPVVIGASLSAGYGAANPFPTVLAPVLGHDEPLPSVASALFFLNPLVAGEQAIEFAQDEEATLVVALDFPFWFGYGTFNAQGGPLADEAQRLELLEAGLGMLEQLDCPIVVADFPDMSFSVGKMLMESQMPSAASLKALNERLHAWAAKRERVRVLPLANFVGKVFADEAVDVGRLRVPAGPRRRLLQRDDLHPTDLGLALLADQVGQIVADAQWAPDSAVTLDFRALCERFEIDSQGIELAPEARAGTPSGAKSVEAGK